MPRVKANVAEVSSIGKSDGAEIVDESVVLKEKKARYEKRKTNM